MTSGMEITKEIATALTFGIRTDTLGFTRSFNELDLKALSWLREWVDWNLLRSFESPPRSKEVLEIFRLALNELETYDNLMLVPIRNLANRDALSQVADFLLPSEGVEIVVTYGVRRNKIILSARSSNQEINIGTILESSFDEGRAGGHKVMAGGQIPFEDINASNDDEAMENIREILKKIFLGV